MANRTTLSSWSPFKNHVQNDIPSSGTFIDSKTTLIAAGPARLSQVVGNTDVAYPIGVGENFGFSQNHAMQRIMEIGSSLHYMIPGHTIGQGQMGRVVFNGRSLLNVAYAASGVTPKESPGDLLWINMASDIFNSPVGVLIYMIDNNQIPYAGIYLEEMYFQNHQMQWSAGATAITEGASFQFMRALPVRLPQSAKTSLDSFLS